MASLDAKKDWKHGGYLVDTVQLDSAQWVNMNRPRTNVAGIYCRLFVCSFHHDAKSESQSLGSRVLNAGCRKDNII